MPDKKHEAIRIATRPQDWIPATRIHLFGVETLSPDERRYELQRMSYGRPAYSRKMRERWGA